jgi:hypothetical protein
MTPYNIFAALHPRRITHLTSSFTFHLSPSNLLPPRSHLVLDSSAFPFVKLATRDNHTLPSVGTQSDTVEYRHEFSSILHLTCDLSNSNRHDMEYLAALTSPLSLL